MRFGKQMGVCVVVALMGLGTARSASAADILGDQIYGILEHNGVPVGSFNNWNVNGSDPSPTAAIVTDPGIEFQIPAGNGNYGFAVASADFTADTISLQIGNPSNSADSFVSVFDMYFSDLNYGGPITNVQLISSNLPGTPTFSFTDDTIQAHLPTGGLIQAHTIYTATFQVTSAPVPLPESVWLGIPCLAALGIRRGMCKAKGLIPA